MGSRYHLLSFSWQFCVEIEIIESSYWNRNGIRWELSRLLISCKFLFIFSLFVWFDKHTDIALSTSLFLQEMIDGEMCLNL